MGHVDKVLVILNIEEKNSPSIKQTIEELYRDFKGNVELLYANNNCRVVNLIEA
jgi:hypothetical protein